VEEVEVKMTAQVRSRPVAHQEVLPDVRNTIAVASGKGGVGKSTVAVNLALALAQTGAQVGLMDADVYGPSIPIMLGTKGQHPQATSDHKIGTIERFGLRMMSIGFLTDERAPVIWRGPMVGKLIQEFLLNVEWGELDYLVVDLPPGTGDAQLTLCQAAPLSGAIVVTTPQEVALEDVVRALRMFNRVEVPVLGIVENMSYFVCPHCGERSHIFRAGGGRRAAEQLRVAFLGEIPLDPAVCESGDEGEPILVRAPDSPTAQAFRDIAGRIAAALSTLSMQQEWLQIS
jgi:ATP-binding protein involved in chromosome partitioning